MKEVNTDSVKNFLLSQDRDQNERANYNSHMDGIQERLIRTVRAVLSSLLQDQAQELDDETLRTLFTEAENVVNSRPLTIGNYQIPDTHESVVPNHQPSFKAKVVLPPPGNLSPPDLYSRKRWHRIRYLSDQFWRRW